MVELFEARTPKGKAPIAELSGRIRIDEGGELSRKVYLIPPDDGSDEIEVPVGRRSRLEVEDGDHVNVGAQLTGGTPDPQDVLRILGVRKVQEHLVEEVQKVYRTQGAAIHEKHIEIIIRQMLRRITVIESGDTTMLPGDWADRSIYESENRRVVAEGGQPASGRPVLMGITKASLATESWLSAASFQETTKVLTDAAINGKSDSLVGLKENVILGKLIPAGTGLERYRNIRVEPTADAKAAAYSMSYDPAYYEFGQGSGQAVPLDDYDLGAGLPLSGSIHPDARGAVRCVRAAPPRAFPGATRSVGAAGKPPTSPLLPTSRSVTMGGQSTSGGRNAAPHL